MGAKQDLHQGGDLYYLDGSSLLCIMRRQWEEEPLIARRFVPRLG